MRRRERKTHNRNYLMMFIGLLLLVDVKQPSARRVFAALASTFGINFGISGLVGAVAPKSTIAANIQICFPHSAASLRGAWFPQDSHPSRDVRANSSIRGR